MKLLFVGDVMLERGVNEMLKEVPPYYRLGDTLPIFSSADVRICNLECVLSDTGAPRAKLKKAFHFRADTKNVEVLREKGGFGLSLSDRTQRIDVTGHVANGFIKTLNNQIECHLR